MVRVLTFISLLVCSYLTFANQKSPLYQVDMIVFTHQSSPSQYEGESAASFKPDTRQAIPLKTDGSKSLTPFHTLPVSLSNLRNEYWALHRKQQYQVLFHYSWLQPANNKKAVAMPLISQAGWNVEGTIRLQQSNYYLLDTELLFSPPHSSQAFVFTQKQRLKAGIVYYLDHPQAGMLIKVHKIS